jgi:hypothetical protein
MRIKLYQKMEYKNVKLAYILYIGTAGNVKRLSFVIKFANHVMVNYKPNVSVVKTIKFLVMMFLIITMGIIAKIHANNTILIILVGVIYV